MATELPRLVPLRAKPDEADTLDAERVKIVTDRWHAQDSAYLGYAKTVEEHIRMLSGRQWDRWSGVYGRFIDVLQFMSETEQRYRTRPVMDYLGYWYVLTLAKAIENPATITFVPSTSDRMDALLAEVMDPVWKTLWHEMSMESNTAMIAAWQLVAGLAYTHTRADFTRGEKRQLIAPAELSLDRGEGLDPIRRMIDAAPYDKAGNPLAQLVGDPNDPESLGYDVTGEPYQDLVGSPAVDILCPLQVRSQWGQHIKWRDKRWIIVESFLTPEQIEEQTGARVQADHYAGDDSDGGPGYLERMLFGTGYFGAVTESSGGALGAQSTASEARQGEGYCRVLTMWEKPRPGFTDASDDTAGGRLLIVAPGPKEVLWDSHRPFRTACAGPIRRVSYIDIPGRPQGTTILERMVPLQRRLNRIEAHIAEHTNKCVDPILFVHEAAAIDEDEWVARPGMVITHGYNGPGAPGFYLAPPPLSADVWKHKADVREQLFIIGSMAGNQSAPPTPTASGELVEQLRVNADRPLTPLTMNLAVALGEIAEDVVSVLPTIWTEEQLISYAGQDNVVRTVKVTPEMLDGSVNARPNIESAAAESKASRRARIMTLYQLGVWGSPIPGQPGNEQARKHLLDLLNFPDLIRAARPGGVDRVMAEHIVGLLIRGTPAHDIPILEMYDLGVHLEVVENEMKSPEFLLQDDAVQHEFETFRQMIFSAQEAQALNEMARQLPIKQAEATVVGSVASSAQQAAGGPSGPGGPGGPGGPAAPGPGPTGPTGPAQPSGPLNGGGPPPSPSPALSPQAA